MRTQVSSSVYKKFLERWEEVTDLPPQQVGPLTPYYKTLVRRLKIMPWPMLVMVSCAVVVGVYLLVGSAVAFIVSLLQRGF